MKNSLIMYGVFGAEAPARQRAAVWAKVYLIHNRYLVF